MSSSKEGDDLENGQAVPLLEGQARSDSKEELKSDKSDKANKVSDEQDETKSLPEESDKMSRLLSEAECKFLSNKLKHFNPQ